MLCRHYILFTRSVEFSYDVTLSELCSDHRHITTVCHRLFQQRRYRATPAFFTTPPADIQPRVEATTGLQACRETPTRTHTAFRRASTRHVYTACQPPVRVDATTATIADTL
jgi:hypothetical protein